MGDQFCIGDGNPAARPVVEGVKYRPCTSRDEAFDANETFAIVEEGGVLTAAQVKVIGADKRFCFLESPVAGLTALHFTCLWVKA